MKYCSIRGLRRILALPVIFFGIYCTPSRNSLAISHEEVKLQVNEKPNVVDYSALVKQEIPSFSDRSTVSRGLLEPMIGGAISLATNIVKQMIANERKKYIASYSVGLKDLYFYDQLSTESAFDPIGLQFNGFTLVRTYLNPQGKTDTALIAHFVLDSQQPYEIINNSIFRLRLRDLELRATRVKLTSGQQRNINMDIEIIFNTSYVNKEGELHRDMELGRFFLFLRGMPAFPGDPAYATYYEKLKGQLLDGKSFLVPRSFGYYISGNGTASPCYSQGAYTVTVNIRESAKDKFVTRIIADNSGKIIDLLENKARSAIH